LKIENTIDIENDNDGIVQEARNKFDSKSEPNRWVELLGPIRKFSKIIKQKETKYIVYQLVLKHVDE
jgi:hypothetical protein